MTDPAVHKLPYWESQPDAFDFVFLGDKRLPGLATFRGIKRGLKVDDKSAKGKHKGPLTLQGYKRAEFELDLEIHGEAEWAELQEWMPELEPVPDKNSASAEDAWDIASPYTAIRAIEAVVIIDVEGPTYRDGFQVLTLKLMEFDKPKPVATGGGGGGLRFGFFLDQTGVPLPGTYVARQGQAATKDDGGPLLDNKGQQVYAWQQLAVMSEVGLTEVSATFLGTFFSHDGLIKLEWEKFYPPGGKPKDVTKTPDSSEGAGSNAEPSPHSILSPSTTDAGP